MKLENIFFPHQEVRALPTHDMEGNRHGSRVTLTNTLSAMQGREDAFGIEVTLSLDEDNSENPPYIFTISAFGIFVTDKNVSEVEQELKAQMELAATQIVVGSIRERLSSITSRAPWGAFTLGIIPLVAQQQEQEQ
ncbi:hypothetical protein Ga0123461_2247 [Mariprofundus aestuarium]|uniref:Preprotein translocase subunit SecB n=1 Tax=Mariprofundus aestuarium TaxID=1921086 RepID=A0A2K8L0R1_MARES|nr:hypothetical protein [Mariprofundus aestuarium]ATX80652.1 hypothetical protein Ga0123461_2247 [Mariprofundus aestuarium]